MSHSIIFREKHQRTAERKGAWAVRNEVTGVVVCSHTKRRNAIRCMKLSEKRTRAREALK